MEPNMPTELPDMMSYVSSTLSLSTFTHRQGTVSEDTNELASHESMETAADDDDDDDDDDDEEEVEEEDKEEIEVERDDDDEEEEEEEEENIIDEDDIMVDVEEVEESVTEQWNSLSTRDNDTDTETAITVVSAQRDASRRREPLTKKALQQAAQQKTMSYDDTKSLSAVSSFSAAQDLSSSSLCKSETNDAVGRQSLRRNAIAKALAAKAGPKPTGHLHPEDRYGKLIFFVLSLTWEWCTWMVMRFFFKAPQAEDLYNMRKKDEANRLQKRFAKHWENCQSSKRPLLRALHAQFAVSLWGTGILKLFVDAVQVAVPFLISFVIKDLSDPDAPVWRGYVWAVALVLAELLGSWGLHTYYDLLNNTGLRMKSIILGRIYRKAIRLSNRARQSRSSGEISNLIGIDCEKVITSIAFLHYNWSGPMQILVCLGLLAYFLQYTIIIGVLAMVAVVGTQVLFMLLFGVLRSRVLRSTDKRLRLSSEILNSIQVIKLFAWEKSFWHKVDGVRSKEMRYFSLVAMVKAVINALLVASPTVVSALSLTGYVLVQKFVLGIDVMQPEIIFTSLSYFMFLRWPLTWLPIVLHMTLDAYISLNRIDNFLQSEEIDDRRKIDNATLEKYPVVVEGGYFEWVEEKTESDYTNGSMNFKFSKESKSSSSKRGITMKSGSSHGDIAEMLDSSLGSFRGLADSYASYHASAGSMHTLTTYTTLAQVSRSHRLAPPADGRLSDINMQLNLGSLTVIVGRIGGGKSSLLAALTGEITKVSGSVELHGELSYSAQQAFITNATVRENILFGRPYNRIRYREVIRVCGLTKDFASLPSGDSTEIGERGDNLSGGQKQRVSLARAVYRDSDIILLDDPLSALDAHLSRKVFRSCILRFLKGKTRVLVTHQLQFAKYADHVIVMERGRIAEQGTYDQLLDANGSLTTMLMEESNKEGEAVGIPRVRSDNMLDLRKSMANLTKLFDEVREVDRRHSTPDVENSMTMHSEEHNTGRITLKTIWRFVSTLGGPVILMGLVMFFIVAQLTQSAVDWWLAQWTGNAFEDLSFWYYLGIYGALGITSVLLILARDIVFQLLGVLSAKRLHDRMFQRLLSAPLTKFFDVQPIGRIINRIGKDQELVDSTIFSTISQLSSIILAVTFVCIIVSVSIPWFALSLPVVAVFYFIIFELYRRSSRELKRLDNISRSPLLSHVAESLHGQETLRIFGRQEYITAKNDENIDKSLRVHYAIVSLQRWLSLRIEALGAFLLFFAMLTALLTKGQFGAANVALGLSYALQFSHSMSILVKTATDLEMHMTSVERIVHYAYEIPTEPKPPPVNVPLSPKWPQYGGIKISNFSARYRQGLPLVLKDINLTIRPGERIGICGRSGCGKSSLTLALYRMLDWEKESSVTIDGEDISTMSLSQLRHRLAIIPQNPVIFADTVRANLDPFNQYQDKFLWKVLTSVRLQRKVLSLSQNLDTPISEDDFSIGQRQLLCLARALCRQSKILIMDEATANCDFSTDAMIQRVLRSAFVDCTQFIIAHRLNSIIDCDRIIVLDDGRIVECDTAANLLLDDESHFSDLVRETGSFNADLMKKLAMGDLDFQVYVEEEEDTNIIKVL